MGLRFPLTWTFGQNPQGRGEEEPRDQGEDTGGGCRGWMGPTLHCLHPSCTASQTLPAHTLNLWLLKFYTGQLRAGMGSMYPKWYGRDPKCQAETGGAPTPSSPQSF